MPSTPNAPGSARPGPRPAAVVNEEIRAIWARGPRWLGDDERARYEELLAEWAAAWRAEVVAAA